MRTKIFRCDFKENIFVVAFERNFSFLKLKCETETILFLCQIFFFISFIMEINQFHKSRELFVRSKKMCPSRINGNLRIAHLTRKIILTANSSIARLKGHQAQIRGVIITTACTDAQAADLVARIIFATRRQPIFHAPN